MRLSVNELIEMAMEVSLNGTKKVAVQFLPTAKMVTFHLFDGYDITKSYAIDAVNHTPEQLNEVFDAIADGIELEAEL